MVPLRALVLGVGGRVMVLASRSDVGAGVDAILTVAADAAFVQFAGAYVMCYEQDGLVNKPTD